MCGICALIRKTDEPPSQELLDLVDQASFRQRHRGPDEYVLQASQLASFKQKEE